MKINAIQNYGYNYNNNHSIQKNTPSFGKLMPSEEYLNDLVTHNKKETIEKIAQFCKQEINLKKLLHYNTLPPERKVLADEYFEAIEKCGGNVEDLHVDIYAKKGISRGDFGHVYERIYAKLKVVLPALDYKEGKISKRFDSTTHSQDYQSRYIQVYDGIEKQNIDEQDINEKYKKVKNYMENEVGFTFNDESRLPVPSEKIYDVLANKINKDLDYLQKRRQEIADEMKKKEHINNLKKIFS